jgi:hypothetical protein
VKLHLLPAACAVVICPISAQTSQMLDLHSQHSKKAYFVVLAARAGSATGHAFVVWGIEDGVRHRSTVRALGLYPDSSSTNCSSLVRTVPGGVLDELQTHSFQGITEELIVRVDQAAYQRSWQVARQWDRDCVEFLRAVGLSLGLDMPRRTILRSTP